MTLLFLVERTIQNSKVAQNKNPLFQQYNRPDFLVMDSLNSQRFSADQKKQIQNQYNNGVAIVQNSLGLDRYFPRKNTCTK